MLYSPPSMRQSPLLICSECGLVETELLECPNCRLNRSRQDSQIAFPPPKFQTTSRLKFDIEQTGSLAIDIGELVCLVGECSTLVDRLCITALLPERHGGFGSPHVLTLGIKLTFIKFRTSIRTGHQGYAEENSR